MPSTPNHETPEPNRMKHRGEERRVTADVHADEVRLLQAECIGDANEELGHR